MTAKQLTRLGQHKARARNRPVYVLVQSFIAPIRITAPLSCGADYVICHPDGHTEHIKGSLTEGARG